MSLADILMRISLACGLLLCLIMVLIGIGMWFTTWHFMTKLIGSALFILAGTGLGSIGVSLWET